MFKTSGLIIGETSGKVLQSSAWTLSSPISFKGFYFLFLFLFRHVNFCHVPYIASFPLDLSLHQCAEIFAAFWKVVLIKQFGVFTKSILGNNYSFTKLMLVCDAVIGLLPHPFSWTCSLNPMSLTWGSVCSYMYSISSTAYLCDPLCSTRAQTFAVCLFLRMWQMHCELKIARNILNKTKTLWKPLKHWSGLLNADSIPQMQF